METYAINGNLNNLNLQFGTVILHFKTLALFLFILYRSKEN
jgi:hypothetical protein